MREIDKFVNGSTVKGQHLLNSAKHYLGTTLSDVYSSYSYDKEKEYNRCKDLFNSMKDATAFSICSKNTWAFTCSWLATFEGESVTIFCTASNTYCIYNDR